MLNALYLYKGVKAPPDRLAREACEIEIGACNKPIGKQDQYIAAYSGLKSFRFLRNGLVGVERIRIGKAERKEGRKMSKAARKKAEKIEKISGQVNVAIDGVMDMIQAGKSRTLGTLPFVNQQESAMARCLLTLLQLKRELQIEQAHADVKIAGTN